MSQPAEWSTPAEVVRLWFAPATLRKTLRIGAVVCVILSPINIGLKLPVLHRMAQWRSSALGL